MRPRRRTRSGSTFAARLSAAAICLAIGTVEAAEIDPAKQWGQWRGPTGNGVALHADPPLTWNEQENIRWKTPLPGRGHSTPIVWGDTLFLTTAVAHGDAGAPLARRSPGAHNNTPSLHRRRFVVLAIDRASGRIRWQTVVRDEQPHETTHETAGWASHSPVTDGRIVVASFGSRGVYGLDFSGEVLWRADPGEMRVKHGHGEGSSPVLHGDTVVVNWDHEGDSFVLALDIATGQQRWKVARAEGTSWSTPLIVAHGASHQVIVAATKQVRAYDMASGSLVWSCGGLSGNVVASPVASDGMVYVGSSYEIQVMMGIRLADARGDITAKKAVVWTRRRHTPYVPSPLLYGEYLYFVSHIQGFMNCVEARSGRAVYGPRHLPDGGMIYASPIGAGGRLYVTARSGVTYVLRHGETFEILARNRLDDVISASPIAVDRELYLRGDRFLYRISEPVTPGE